MTKNQIRDLKSHYQSRWSIFRHNNKQQEKLLLLEDQFVLKNLLPGKTLCYNCLGELYQDIVEQLSVCPGQKVNNLVLINNIELKYKTVDQINAWLTIMAQENVLLGGRIIFSVEHKYLIYNRTHISVDTLLQSWFLNFQDFKVIKFLNLLYRNTPGYGTYFFCVDYINA